MSLPHVASEPATLCFGAPVVLISTLNEDGTPNLASVSSAFWLGWRCIPGLSNSAKTPQNMVRTGECVLNLPSVNEAGAVDRLAMPRGVKDVPEGMTFIDDEVGAQARRPVAEDDHPQELRLNICRHRARLSDGRWRYREQPRP